MDILPRGIFMGGAPLNVAYHASRLGLKVVPVSAVGRDFLGDEALRRVASWGLTTKFIARVRRRPTGSVRATLDASGAASYLIASHVAWDCIPTPAALRRMPDPAAVVYGTLALREDPNRFRFMDLMAAWSGSFRVLDLNLRAPFDEGVGVKLALSHAQLVKLNDEELARMTHLPVRNAGQLEAAARRFSADHHSVKVCVTAGARGAGLLWGDDWHWESGRAVAVRDTVGAGDACLAGFLAAQLLRAETPFEALVSACRLGEFVATQDGATPPYRGDPRGCPRAVEASPTLARNRPP